MSRILLLSANTTVSPYPVYPVGMGAVAAALVGRGHDVLQVDFLSIDCSQAALRETLSAFCPDFVGISLRNLDSADALSGEDEWFLQTSKEIVAFVREATDAPVILGGAAFSILPEEILDFLNGDYGIVGEGERAVCELIARLEAGEDVPAILRDGQGPLAGEDIAAPLLDSDLVRFYRSESGILSVQTKRGCSHHCVYCTYPSLEGHRVRARPPEQVVDEIARMTRDHGLTDLFFTDSVFNDEEGHYLRLAEELIRRGLGVRWCAFFRPSGMGRGELALLKRAGLYALEVGTDAASDATLAGLGKQFSFSDVVEFSRLCSDLELPCAHFVTFGGPGETHASLQEGLRNLDRLGECVIFGFTGLRVYPGTPLHALAIRDGIVSESASLLRPVHYFSPKVEIEALTSEVARAFSHFRQRLFPPSESTERLDVMHRFGYRGILWDTLISYRGRIAASEDRTAPGESKGNRGVSLG